MEFEIVNHINPIGAIKSFKNPNFNLCMEEHLKILKNLRDKCVALMNNNLEIYETFRHKNTFHIFFLTGDTING